MNKRDGICLAIALLLSSHVALAQCDGPRLPCERNDFEATETQGNTPIILGIRRFDADENRIITGWRLGDHWYLGHERRSHSDFGLVRRGERSAFAIGNKGIEVTLRF